MQSNGFLISDFKKYVYLTLMILIFGTRIEVLKDKRKKMQRFSYERLKSNECYIKLHINKIL